MHTRKSLQLSGEGPQEIPKGLTDQMKTAIVIILVLALALSAQRVVSPGQITGTSGDGPTLVTTRGTQTVGDCVKVDATGNHVPSGAPCPPAGATGPTGATGPAGTTGGTGSQGPSLHAITFSIDGGGVAIATGAIGQFSPVDYACTITRVDVTSDQSGSITIDIWKSAGAIPTGANKISASAPITLASSQISLAGSLTGWTTSVSIGDVFGGTVATASTVTKATAVIWCQ